MQVYLLVVNVDQANSPTSGDSPCKNQRQTEYAGVVELVDSVDLGAVTLVKVFLPPPAQKMKMRV